MKLPIAAAAAAAAALAAPVNADEALAKKLVDWILKLG